MYIYIILSHIYINIYISYHYILVWYISHSNCPEIGHVQRTDQPGILVGLRSAGTAPGHNLPLIGRTYWIWQIWRRGLIYIYTYKYIYIHIYIYRCVYIYIHCTICCIIYCTTFKSFLKLMCVSGWRFTMERILVSVFSLMFAFVLLKQTP